MITIQNITYLHPDKAVLFHDINFTINSQDKVALIGNNGSGKSTLLKVMAGELPVSGGTVKASSKPYYVPQQYGQFNYLTVAQALNVEVKIKALHSILNGNVSDSNLNILNEDWTIEERCREALSFWKLESINMEQKMETLSGGQKTKVFLAGISIHQPEIVLLDEPSNHLDNFGRQQLYHFVQSCQCTLIVVSHDRTLLNLPDMVYELNRRGVTVYGGNYDFYAQQKAIESDALNHDVRTREKALRKAKEVERDTAERQQKLDARGKKKQEKAGLPTISMNTLRNNAEKSTSRMKGVHAEKVNLIAQELNNLRRELPAIDTMKFAFDDSSLHKGKILFKASELNFSFLQTPLWKNPLDFEITSAERIALQGANGSGKTTLVKIILGQLEPQSGTVYRSVNNAVYIDQDYSLLNDHLSVYKQAQTFNVSSLQEHEVKTRLNRFLFTKDDWDKPCIALSGGEKMKLILCCLTIRNLAPDLIVLDEPTNNLDIQNIEILANAIKEYSGTVIAISHDLYFLEQISIVRKITLE